MTYVSFRILFLKLRKEERHTGRSLQLEFKQCSFYGVPYSRWDSPLLHKGAADLSKPDDFFRLAL